MSTASSAPQSSFLRPLVGLVLIVAILILAKTVIVPLVLAVLLTFVLAPVVNAIQRRGFGRLTAVVITVLLTAVVLALVGWMLGAQARHLAQELPTHREEIDAKIASLRPNRKGAFPKLQKMIREVGKGETEADAIHKDNVPKGQVVVVQPQEPSNFEQLANTAGPVLEPLAQAGLVVVLVIFMLIQREDLRNRMIGLLGHGRLTGTTRVLVESGQRLSRFLLTQTLINVGFGVVFALMLLLIGVPYALLWGGLAVVLRFVPFIGSMIAAGFPLVLAFAVTPGWTAPVLVLTLVLVLELITANVVEPLLIGHGTGVSPIALLVAAAFWTWVWGPIGLVLATPLTVCLVVLGQNFPPLRVLALLLGNAPALEPRIAYYQRLLSHDSHEAKQIAEKVAEGGGLEKVCDDVLLPALALARLDRKNAGLSAEDEAFVFQTTKDILESVANQLTATPELSLPVDADRDVPLTEAPRPETGSNSALILGCAAHHEAEEISVLMLAELLKLDGCRVEPVSTRSLPVDVEAKIQQDSPALVFIAILPPGGFLQARYLCKRLRKRFPALPIIVGYWGDGRHYDQVLVRLRSTGASYVTTSLLQSRSQIRAMVSHAPNVNSKPAPQLAPAPSVANSANVSPSDLSILFRARQ